MGSRSNHFDLERRVGRQQGAAEAGPQATRKASDQGVQSARPISKR